MNNNKGVIPLRLGEGKIIDSYYKLIHLVNITEYENNINSLSNNYESLCRKINSIDKFQNKSSTSYNRSLSASLLTGKKLKKLYHVLHTLLPVNRRKRGIFNGLGTVIKSITGNLDSRDLNKINNVFRELQSNDNIFKESLMKKLL